MASFEEHNAGGKSPWFLLCDHASRRIPSELGTLGLPFELTETHIGWDIGSLGVARSLSTALDAPLVASTTSRLVIDANRPIGAPTSIPEVTCDIPVPGNVGLSAEERADRADRWFWPYHRRAAELLDERQARGRSSVLLSVHSFTPELYGKKRPWHVGILYGRDRRLADAFLSEFAKESDLVVGDNEPYRVTDSSDYAVPVYGEQAGRLAVLLEIRQDLITEASAQRAFADRLVPVLDRILRAALEVPLP